MRIIAGQLRGRKIHAPVSGVRPTSDRVRESIFSRLGDCAGSRVLDLFAGSGALGLEAISRGADGAVFVERSGRVVTALRATLRAFSVEGQTEVLKLDARGGIRRLSKREVQFDLVFIDPPYADYAELPGLLSFVVASDLLAPASEVVVEFASRDEPSLELELIEGLSVDSRRQYGETTVVWLSPRTGGHESLGSGTE